MRVLLTTIVIGDKYLEEYNNLFRQSQVNYALKNGYEFNVISHFLDPITQHHSTITLNKLLLCSQGWAEQFDFIIFVDADIFININAPPIHNFINYGNNIGVVDEYSQPSKERRLNIQRRNGWETSAIDYYKMYNLNIETDMVFNSGLLVLQPRIHRHFLQDIYNKYINQCISQKSFHFEQACIGYEIQKANLFTVLDNRFNAIWGLAKADNIENYNLETFFNNNFFIHFAGHDDWDKVINLHYV